MAHFGTRITFEKQGVSDKNSFDLGRPDTYYTRPMSPPWSKPLEVDRLADGGADVDFAIPLAELSGLRPLRAGVAGSVAGRAHFTRQRGLAVAEVALAGEATLPCQRCLQPMQLPLRSRVRVALVNTEAEAARVPEELEPMLAPGGRISIGELIAEELLLSLPIVALHEGAGQCGSAPPEANGAPGETHRPFAQLADLLKR
jgi:uncharacterized protein